MRALSLPISINLGLMDFLRALRVTTSSPHACLSLAPPAMGYNASHASRKAFL